MAFASLESAPLPELRGDNLSGLYGMLVVLRKIILSRTSISFVCNPYSPNLNKKDKIETSLYGANLFRNLCKERKIILCSNTISDPSSFLSKLNDDF